MKAVVLAVGWLQAERSDLEQVCAEGNMQSHWEPAPWTVLVQHCDPRAPAGQWRATPKEVCDGPGLSLSTSSSSCASQKRWPPSNTPTRAATQSVGTGVRSAGSSLHGASGQGSWGTSLTGRTCCALPVLCHRWPPLMGRLYPSRKHGVTWLCHLSGDEKARKRACVWP